MLFYEWGLTKTDAGALNVFRANSGKDAFVDWLNYIFRFSLSSTIQEIFCQAVRGTDLKSRFESLQAEFKKLNNAVPSGLAANRNTFLNELRALLAQACLSALKPDLTILDEFQRFKRLLDPNDKAGELASDLFNYVGQDSVDSGARVLLLSATPYKMYTLSHESDTDDHYADFLSTLEFLHNEKSAFDQTKDKLSAYRQQLVQISKGENLQLKLAKHELENQLRRVMVRTERLAASTNRDGMLREINVSPPLQSCDLEDYVALQKIAKAIEHPDVTEYWKSTPYLLNFMMADDYKFKRDLIQAIDEENALVLESLADAPQLLLKRRSLERQRPLEAANARLRGLMENTLDQGLWRLLWLPPSLPYYRLGAPFNDPALARVTKRLIFSAWRVVPRAIGTLLSYEAERRIFGSFHALDGRQMMAKREKHSPLLRFAVVEPHSKNENATGENATIESGRETGMSVLGITYPSMTLARLGDPLTAMFALRKKGNLPSIAAVINFVRQRIAVLLKPLLAAYVGKEKAIDSSWYWAAPLLLDQLNDREVTRNWLNQKDITSKWLGADTEVDSGRGLHVKCAHVKHAIDTWNAPTVLGRPPKDLLDVLTQIAIAGPGVCALRSLARVSGGIDKNATGEGVAISLAQRNGASQVALGFVHLFNQAEATTLIRGMASPTETKPYWRQVLDYCLAGGLQPVLDEYAHTLRESACAPQDSAIEVASKVATSMSDAVALRVSSLSADAFDDHSLNGPASDTSKSRWQLRTHFAIHFGINSSKEDSQHEYTRPSQVRDAFNSPFWPFVLATTAVGQEGLDFHTYCHAVMHWNLPSNPVDMEQREGRVHRYKGHAVRKNVARDHRGQLNEAESEGNDPWAQLFAKAKQACPDGSMDLMPYWTYPASDNGGAYIERHTPVFALSRDADRLIRLRKSLAVYRMVFGQARQEDLLEYLSRHMTSDELSDFAEMACINLEPPHRKS